MDKVYLNQGRNLVAASRKMAKVVLATNIGK
jgi:hypothetical protein